MVLVLSLVLLMQLIRKLLELFYRLCVAHKQHGSLAALHGLQALFPAFVKHTPPSIPCLERFGCSILATWKLHWPIKWFACHFSTTSLQCMQSLSSHMAQDYAYAWRICAKTVWLNQISPWQDRKCLVYSGCMIGDLLANIIDWFRGNSVTLIQNVFHICR